MKSGFIKTFLQMAPFLGSAHLLVAWISTASSLHGTALDILTQHPDYNKTVPELIRSYGYPVEEHEVVSEDGYVLTLHRIPHGKADSGSDPKIKVPVLLGHCMVASSAVWSLMPNHSLAYSLADSGYDVWMINIRGNHYSKKHLTLSPDDSEFWNFSHHESALLDYPATIDYIRQTTGQPSMFFVGYSMGTTQYLILLAEKPEYNQAIRAGFLMGPAAVGKHATNPAVAASPYAEVIESAANFLGFYEILPNFLHLSPNFKTFMAKTICDSGRFQQELCANFFEAFVGMVPGRIDPTMVSTILSHSPGGASSKLCTHMAQIFRNGEHLSKYDYGPEINLKVYGTSHPEPYNMSNVVAPTALIGGDRDGFVVKRDIDILASQLPNVVMNYQVEKEGFGHLDFVFGLGADTYVNTPIIEKMNELIR